MLLSLSLSLFNLQDLSESEFRALYDRLDIVVCFQLEGLVDTGLPLIIVDDVVEFLTISGCARVFDYAESRVKELTLVRAACIQMYTMIPRTGIQRIVLSHFDLITGHVTITRKGSDALANV